MKCTDYGRSALGICATVAMVSGCGGLQPPIGAPGALQQSTGIAGPESAAAARTMSYHVLHSFRAPGHDGSYPIATLINVSGTLYGTTQRGGAHRCFLPRGYTAGCGTVFSITTTGKEKSLHSFAGTSDGADPQASLINVNGTLYGTTTYGGANGDGIVYSISTAGTETVLYSFAGGSDGANPTGGLIDVNGTMYGTTYSGGESDEGTVFSVTTTGSEKVLYSFSSSGSDGGNPAASLVSVKGTLYGTTFNGGANDEGTVFSVTTTGSEDVLYSFAGGIDDGADPYGGLLNVNGTLYGTTLSGGYGFAGTVFRITTTGREKLLYRFLGGSGGSDGANPFVGLTNTKSTLYGTTEFGGANGDGTVYSITTAGTETVLYSFAGNPDGANPLTGLINVKGTLYGETYFGGGYGCHRGNSNHGCGTVFALTP